MQSNSNLIVSVASKKSDTNKKTNQIKKKLQKIEKLKKQLQNANSTIATAKVLYQEHCIPEEEKVHALQEELIAKLANRYKQKGFAKWQKELMQTMLENGIQELMNAGYQSEIVNTIYEELNKNNLEDLDDFEKEMMKDMAKSYFKDMGVDMDGEDFDFEDIFDAEFKERIHKKQEAEYSKEYEQFHEEENAYKAQLQQEKTQNTDVDFQKLYKTLVKKAHPDLVTDEEEKASREEWMKALSAAWEERNYYQLLLLQQEIDKDAADSIEIKDSQAKALLKELDVEIQKLEAEKYTIKNFDEETAFYFQNFNSKTEKGILKKILEYKGFIVDKRINVASEIEAMKTQKSTKELLVGIRDNQVFF